MATHEQYYLTCNCCGINTLAAMGESWLKLQTKYEG